MEWIPWVLLGTIWATFGRAITFDIVDWDDPVFVVDNEYVPQGLTMSGFHWAFTTHLNGMWHPLTWLSFMTEVSLFGNNASAFHTTNLWIHAANVFLVWRLFKEVITSRITCAAAAFIFASHPMNVESVAWIAERKGLLSSLWILLVIFQYVLFLKHTRPIYYIVAVLCALCALMSKSNSVILPCLLLLIDITLRMGGLQALHTTFRARYQKQTLSSFLVERSLVLAPFILCAIAAGVMALSSEQSAGAITDRSWDYRVANIVCSLFDLGERALIPVNLSALYPAPEAWGLWSVMLKLSVVTAIFIAVGRNARRTPNAMFVLLWFVIVIAPVSGIVRFGPHYTADRYAYLALLPVFAYFSQWIGCRYGWKALMLLTILCIMCTTAQLSVWRNSETLWNRVLATNSHLEAYNTFYLAPAYNNLGLYLMSEGRTSEAERCFKDSLFSSVNPEAIINLAAIEKRKRHSKRELTILRCGLRMMPMEPMILVELGNTLKRGGHEAEALSRYEEALFVEPRNAAALERLALLLMTSRNSAVHDAFRGLTVARRALTVNQSGPSRLLSSVVERYTKGSGNLK